MRPRVAFKDIFILVIFGIAVSVLTALLALSLGASRFSAAMIEASVSSICWMGGYEWMASSRGWHSLRIRFSSVGGKVLLGSAAGAIALIGLMAGAIVILEKLGVTVTGSPSIISADDLRRHPLAIAEIVIIAPLGEELMFRGLLLDWLRQKLAPWLAIALISLVFALLHDNGLRNGAGGWIAFADRFLFSVGATFLVLRFNSLRPAFVLHATNNCAAVAAVMLSA